MFHKKCLKIYFYVILIILTSHNFTKMKNFENFFFYLIKKCYIRQIITYTILI